MRQSGERVRPRPIPADEKSRWPVRWNSVVPVVVILIWLLASWSAPATQLALVASAVSVSPPRATVTAAYTSSGHTNAMIRLYVNGKRWGSSELAAGSWQVANLPVSVTSMNGVQNVATAIAVNGRSGFQ